MKSPAPPTRETPCDSKEHQGSVSLYQPRPHVHSSIIDELHDKSASVMSEHRKAPPYSTLGQISYAPTTQTTVVTTTTMTTTSFPPFVMNAPRNLTRRDPKLYPLASASTPPHLRQFWFDLNGTPALFREAPDTEQELKEYENQCVSLEKNNGEIRTVSARMFDNEIPAHSPNFASPQSLGSHNQKQSVTPVSLSDAAEIASSSRRKRVSRRLRSRRCVSRPHPLAQGQTHELQSERHDHAHHPQIGETNSHASLGFDQFPGHRTPADASQRTENVNEWRSRQHDLSAENLRHLEVLGEREAVPGLGFSLNQDGQPITATPPIIESVLDPMQALHVRADHARPGVSRLLSHTPLQEASLPSPSLSPITGAAQLNYDSESSGFADDDSSFEDAPSTLATKTAPMHNQQTLSPPPGQSDEEQTEEMGADEQQLPTATLSDIPSMLDTFDAMPDKMKSYVMFQLLRRCSKPTLHIVADEVNRNLKCDFLKLLPVELSLNVLKHLDVKSMCRAAQVSRKWRHMVNSDEKAWKELLEADGYRIPREEVHRAVKEGWGWQHSVGKNEPEKDLGSLRGQAVADSLAYKNAVADMTSTAASTAALPQQKRKRRTSAKLTSNKRLKRQNTSASGANPTCGIRSLELAQGPHVLANAAAAAVPYPNDGLPSLSTLHLFKSIYRRHHLIRKSWMQTDAKPQHIAFRAHQRHVVTCLQFDDEKILTGSDDTNINVYDTKTGALLKTLEGHEGGVWALEYQGNILVSGSTDRTVRIWNIDDGECLQVFQGHTSTVRCLQILHPVKVGEATDGTPVMAPTRPLIITGSRDSNLRVWRLPSATDRSVYQTGPTASDADNPYFIRALTGHLNSVRAIAAYADTLVSGSYDSSVRVWKISNGELVHRLTGHTTKVYSVVLDYPRNRCISGSMDNLVKVWSLETGSCLFNLEGHTSLVGLLDLRHDCLVSAAADSTLRIWDPENGRCRNTLRAHTGAITCFQHDGQKIISGSDRTLKMWNVETGQCLKDLLVDLSGVWQVKFDERRCIAAVQRDGVTYIEVLDFGASRDGVPDKERGRRIVVDTNGHEAPPEALIEPEVFEARP